MWNKLLTTDHICCRCSRVEYYCDNNVLLLLQYLCRGTCWTLVECYICFMSPFCSSFSHVFREQGEQETQNSRREGRGKGFASCCETNGGRAGEREGHTEHGSFIFREGFHPHHLSFSILPPFSVLPLPPCRMSTLLRSQLSVGGRR